MVTGPSVRPDVVLDCRWLRIWGAGRVTRLLLAGLAEDPPQSPDRWAVWGGAEAMALAWPRATTVTTDTDPRSLFGQRSWFEVPPAGVTVFLHQQRPLRAVPAVTLIYDTIALRYGGTRAERIARRSYLRRVAAVSLAIITISRFSARCIASDLGVDESRIHPILLPMDGQVAARLSGRRRATTQEDFALYVGWFAPHKNLDRLVTAFERTRFCAGGGRLVLAGGAPEQVASLEARLTPRQRAFVDVRGWCEQDELDSLMVTARFLVQPSLEEGFGLPVLEALSCGLPVCASDGGALPEVTRRLVPTFSATSVEEMTRALDECAQRGPVVDPAVTAEILSGVPTVAEYARRFRRVVEDSLPVAR